MNKTYLVHHGIKGQRWGVRRYQNNDGSLTPAGRKKYDVNEDGTTKMKDSYRRGQNVRGIAKTIVGTSLVTKGAAKLNAAKRHGIDTSTKAGKKFMVGAVLQTVLGAALATSASVNFVNAMKNKSFNSTGMGGTPESFTGKAKTQAQVIAAQNRANKK